MPIEQEKTRLQRACLELLGSEHTGVNLLPLREAVDTEIKNAASGISVLEALLAVPEDQRARALRAAAVYFDVDLAAEGTD